MTELKLPAGGTCRCTAVRFELLAAPLMTAACHCTDCRRLSSSAFSLTAMIPADGFKILEGEPVEKSLPGSSRRHYFCPDCMTWLFTRLEGVDDRINVRTALCDDPSWARPFVETMTREKLPWATTPAVYSYEGFPSREEFRSVMEKYSVHQKSG